MCLYLCYLHLLYALLRYILLTFVEIMMAFMRRLLTILLLGLCLVACTQHSTYWGTLLDIESYIEERPDSALVVLEQIDISQLSNKEEKAKHAVLLSMALDKNYVDKTDFEVLQPAIDYYEDNGSATDKLRTYYYQGRIHQNAGNDAAAIRCYVNALDKGAGSNDDLTKARTLVAQSTIYYSLMKWDKVYDVSIKAANYYFELGRVNNYVLSLLRCIGGCIQNNDYDKAKELLDECYQHINNLPEHIVSEIYSYNLLCLSYSDDAEVVRRVINEYTEQVADSKIDYLTIAGAYTDIGAYHEAESTLQKIDVNTFKDDYRVLKYYTTLLRVYEHKDDFKSAYDVYKKFNKLNDSIVLSIFESDTQFIEEKYALELQNRQEKENRYKVIIISIVLVSILLTIVIYIRGKLKYRTIQKAHAEQEAERYKLLYEQIVYEKDNLSELLSHSNDLDNNVREVVAKRIELLNKFFTIYITNNSKISRKVDKELDELLANKGLFISSTRLAFVGSHPKFIKYLEEHNLSEQEIEICCLYAIGLKGKDIKAYTSQPRHYNQSADIRHKLGLTESDTNLSIFLRDLLKK